MPHIIVEHTADIEAVDGLLSALHESLAGQETVALESIKTRSIEVKNAIVGNGSQNSMIHVMVKLLSGRSDQLLKKMTGDLRDVALQNISGNTSVTVEAIALHDESYQK